MGSHWEWTTSSTRGLLFIWELTGRCKGKKNVIDPPWHSVSMCFCVSVCFSVYKVWTVFIEACMCLCAFALQNILCFFSSQHYFPLSVEKVLYQITQGLEIPRLPGENLIQWLVLHTGLNLAVTQLRRGSIFLSIFVWQVYTAAHTSNDGPGEWRTGLLVPDSGQSKQCISGVDPVLICDIPLNIRDFRSEGPNAC